MADDVDRATELQDTLLAHSIAAARTPIAVGVAGTCHECREFMPRLVKGWCAFCRDDRDKAAKRRA